MVFFVIFLVSAFVSFFVAISRHGDSTSKEHKERERDTADAIELYTKCKNEVDIPERTYTVKARYYDNKGYRQHMPFHFWRHTDIFRFFPMPEKAIYIMPVAHEHYMKHWATEYNVSKTEYELFEIPISSIKYFQKQGEIYRKNKIAGGGGGGSSVKGAIVGGVIAGGAGAIIGSRKKIDSISSTLITHDDRECVLTYLTKDGLEKNLHFDYDTYQILKDIIPEKEYEIIEEIKTSEILESHKAKSIADRIRQLEELKNDGILTDEEFALKKDKILEQI